MGSRSRQARAAALGTTLLGAPACCVCASTLVRTPDGPRPIGELKVGDLVLSLVVLSGELVSARVVAVRTAARECLWLEHAGGELVCTPDHPIYCPETGEYEPASRWVEGMRHTVLVVAEGAAAAVAPVTRAVAFVGVREVVDVTVDAPMHNFVAAGLLVHNKSYVTGVFGYVDGPEFSLAADALVRSFGIRACVDGRDPREDESYMTVRIDTLDEPAASMGAMWFAVYFQGQSEGSEATSFVDYASGDDPYLRVDTMAGMCLSPLEIVFERLDGLPDGEIGFSWTVSGHSEPPEGTDLDDAIAMAIRELDEG
jgi:hypothetical protein